MEVNTLKKFDEYVFDQKTVKENWEILKNILKNQKKFPIQLIEIKNIIENKLSEIDICDQIIKEKGVIRFDKESNEFSIVLNKIYQEEINRFTSFHELAHYFFDTDKIKMVKYYQVITMMKLFIILVLKLELIDLLPKY